MTLCFPKHRLHPASRRLRRGCRPGLGPKSSPSSSIHRHNRNTPTANTQITQDNASTQTALGMPGSRIASPCGGMGLGTLVSAGKEMPSTPLHFPEHLWSKGWGRAGHRQHLRGRRMHISPVQAGFTQGTERQRWQTVWVLSLVLEVGEEGHGRPGARTGAVAHLIPHITMKNLTAKTRSVTSLGLGRAGISHGGWPAAGRRNTKTPLEALNEAPCRKQVDAAYTAPLLCPAAPCTSAGNGHISHERVHARAGAGETPSASRFRMGAPTLGYTPRAFPAPSPQPRCPFC